MKVTLIAGILFQVEKSLTFHQKVQGEIFIKLILSDFFFSLCTNYWYWHLVGDWSLT